MCGNIMKIVFMHKNLNNRLTQTNLIQLRHDINKNKGYFKPKKSNKKLNNYK